MTIIKIPTVNDTYTGHVTEAREVEGKFGIQACYTFSNGDQLYMPVKSSTIQLLRCGGFDNGQNPPAVEYAAVAGNTLHFSRTANRTENASPYYNIEIVNGAAPAPSKRLPSPTVVPGEQVKANPDNRVASQPSSPAGGRTRQQVADAYAWCLRTALDAQEGMDGMNAQSVQAGAATLLIQLEKSGLIFQPLTLTQVAAALDLRPKRVQPPTKGQMEDFDAAMNDLDTVPF